MELVFQHKNLAQGKWFDFSFAEQMANIGSEISRAKNWQNKDKKQFKNALFRALELVFLTAKDKRWRKRLKEILRLKEVIGDILYGGKEYKSNLEDLEKYFMQFALIARRKIN